MRPFPFYARWAVQRRKEEMTQIMKSQGVKCYNCQSDNIEALGYDAALGCYKYHCKNCGVDWFVVKRQ